MNDWPIYIGLPLWFWLFIFPTLIAALCMISRQLAQRLFEPIWKVLDRIYVISGVIAAGHTPCRRRVLRGCGLHVLLLRRA